MSGIHLHRQRGRTADTEAARKSRRDWGTDQRAVKLRDRRQHRRPTLEDLLERVLRRKQGFDEHHRTTHQQREQHPDRHHITMKERQHHSEPVHVHRFEHNPAALHIVEKIAV